LLFLTLVMTSTQVYFAFAKVSMLFFGVILCGFTFGGIFCTVATIIADLYGSRYFGANYGVLDSAPAIGSFLLATLLAGRIYDQYANLEHNCFGLVCFKETFLITAGVNLGAVVFCIAFMHFTGQHYAKNK